MSDSDLEQAIRAKLESDAQLKDAKLDVDANADKNECHNIRHRAFSGRADQGD
jgi:hypothetical protein